MRSISLSERKNEKEVKQYYAFAKSWLGYATRGVWKFKDKPSWQWPQSLLIWKWRSRSCSDLSLPRHFCCGLPISVYVDYFPLSPGLFTQWISIAYLQQRFNICPKANLPLLCSRLFYYFIKYYPNWLPCLLRVCRWHLASNVFPLLFSP